MPARRRGHGLQRIEPCEGSGSWAAGDTVTPTTAICPVCGREVKFHPSTGNLARHGHKMTYYPPQPTVGRTEEDR